MALSKKKAAAAKAAATRKARKEEAAAEMAAADDLVGEGEVAAEGEAEGEAEAVAEAAPQAGEPEAPEVETGAPKDSEIAPQAAPEAAPEAALEATSTDEAPEEAPAPAPAPAPESTAAPAAVDRMARFRELQARAKASSAQNTKAAAAEMQRLASDPTQLPALRRKHAIATHKLLKADVEEAGEDFERKRAWDWTAEESERWDKRMRKKAAHRDNNAFQDYTQEAHKVYKRQLRMNKLDGGSGGGGGDGNGEGASSAVVDQYVREKLAAVERAAAAGTLELVETADGELVAIDKEGTFFSAAESTTFGSNRPSKEAIDRLVRDQTQAEEAAARKKRARMEKNGEDPDVTFINEKNKHFNQKLARFYNKYTAEIRESFERGTMI